MAIERSRFLIQGPAIAQSCSLWLLWGKDANLRRSWLVVLMPSPVPSASFAFLGLALPLRCTNALFC